MNERAISFTNGNGLRLHGVLHVPDHRAHTRLGVVLLSPGQKCRLGPWRSYVRLARRLARMGIPVLRFDFHGLGDSEGSHAQLEQLVDFNGFVQTGGLVPDVFAATEFFTRETGVTRFVFAGLCGGAATGLLASVQMPGVFGHVMLDLPVTVSNAARQRYLEQNAAEILRMRPEESHGVLRSYFERLRDRAAWVRLFSGESDYRLLGETLRIVSHRALEGVLDRLPTAIAARLRPAPVLVASNPATTAADSAVEGAVERVNDIVVTAFEAARAQGQRVFFLNSSAYNATFDSFFGNTVLTPDKLGRGCGKLVVPESNHIFSPEHAQAVFFETVEEFVRNAMADLAERPSFVARTSSYETATAR